MSTERVLRTRHKPPVRKSKGELSQSQEADKAKIDQQIQKELTRTYEVIKPKDHELFQIVHVISAEKISEDSVKFRTDGVDTFKKLSKDKPTIFNQE